MSASYLDSESQTISDPDSEKAFVGGPLELDMHLKFAFLLYRVYFQVLKQPGKILNQL